MPQPPTTHLHIDPFSGIAGDMFLGALIDLGVPLDEIRAALAPLELAEPYEITAEKVQRCGVGGINLRVVTAGHPQEHGSDDPDAEHDHAHPHPHHPHGHTHDHGHDHSHAHPHSHDHSHPHTHNHHGDDNHHEHVGYRQIMAMIDQLDLGARSRKWAQAVVTKLADAESRVHGVDREAIHFHEVGAVDSIVDMLGSVIALQLLGVDSVSCGPVPLSRGYVKCAHGLMPVPAPATAYLLDGIPTVGVDRTGELVTPTGAALIAGLCDRFGPPPAMTLRGVGYGAGDRDDPDVPNLLRLMLGERTAGGDLGPITPTAAPALADVPAR